jgi:hypothetical protein
MNRFAIPLPAFIFISTAVIEDHFMIEAADYHPDSPLANGGVEIPLPIPAGAVFSSL